ncbi:MAG: hypothetical protein FWD53_11805 [Phycisphaerales bacterium]|nr:hypothetical protein [Phycisphaerales bacterium]
MALSLDKIKKDFAKNRTRWIVIASLASLLMVLTVKAYFEMKPRSANAGTFDAAINSINENIDTHESLNAVEVDAKLEQSRKLWQTLRTERGVAANAAFKFIPMYYSPAPGRQHTARQAAGELLSPSGEGRDQLTHASEIHQAAKKLVVKSTVVGSSNSRPVAVINGKILGVGDRINEFEIVSIKAREVAFKKDGVIVTVEMAGTLAPSNERRGR